jgi:superfamily II DNA or RNA helicase
LTQIEFVFMNKKVVYTLQLHGSLGAVPECCIVDVDEQGAIGSKFVAINSTNKSFYTYLYNENDEMLIDCCIQLNIKSIAKKISKASIKQFDDLLKAYIEVKQKKSNSESDYFKDYILDYVSIYQNRFFNHIADRELYLPEGNFPFSWKRVYYEDEMPDLYYHFDNQDDGIIYTLVSDFDNRKLSLKGAQLISRKAARILVRNKILEFDKEIEGTKLLPFFTKETIRIPAANKTEYIQKVIQPLVKSKKVIASGFSIIHHTDITEVELRVSEIAREQQMALFEGDSPQLQYQHLIFELFFKYNNFQFRAGSTGKTTQLNFENESFSIEFVERDIVAEKTYADIVKNSGLDLDGKVKKLPYYEGFEWINEHKNEIESQGIELEFIRKNLNMPDYFLGERSISVAIEEKNDWFDIRGKVKFGEFEIPLITVLHHLRHNKRQILLPDGRYAQIPQSWFDEYLSLAELSKFENGQITFSKQFVVLAQQMATACHIKLEIKENLLKLLRGDYQMNYQMPAHFEGELRPYQTDGYNWLRLLDELKLGGCLADDMGLGKTIQTLCLLQWLKEEGRGVNLLIVPTSLVHNWQKEIEKFTPSLRVYVHAGSQRDKEKLPVSEYDLILTSYPVIRRDKVLFGNYHYHYIILDEAQMIKNPIADVTRVCLNLRGKHFLTLTGTPIENSLSDLWSQVHFFSRNMLGALTHFMKEAQEPGKQELYRKLLKPFMLRRKKTEVLKDLPEKNIIVQHCEMPPAQETFYKTLRNSYREKFLGGTKKGEKLNPFVLLEGLLRLRQAANHPVIIDKEFADNSGKFEMVLQLLGDVIDQGDKVLIFSSFVEHLKLYRQYLDEQGIRYCYIDGSTKDRKEQVEKFQESDDFPVFLLSLKAGGTGLNLTRANYVFLLDPWWNPAAEMQAFDRAHRIGQQKSVFVYKFISRNTIEEKIQKLQEKKLLLSDTMLADDNNILKQLEIDEVMSLLE